MENNMMMTITEKDILEAHQMFEILAKDEGEFNKFASETSEALAYTFKFVGEMGAEEFVNFIKQPIIEWVLLHDDAWWEEVFFGLVKFMDVCTSVNEETTEEIEGA